MLNYPFIKKFTSSGLLIIGLLLAVSSFFFSGCMKDDSNLEELQRLQEEAYLKQLGEDTLIIKKFLADNSITKYKRTQSGLFYVTQDSGQGIKPKVGNTVSVNYVLKDLIGKQLDASQAGKPFEFQLGGNGVIFGFQEGVSLMRVGGKSTVYLPSGIAYGAEGNRGIAPNTILTFSLELVGVK